MGYRKRPTVRNTKIVLLICIVTLNNSGPFRASVSRTVKNLIFAKQTSSVHLIIFVGISMRKTVRLKPRNACKFTMLKKTKNLVGSAKTH